MRLEASGAIPIINSPSPENIYLDVPNQLEL